MTAAAITFISRSPAPALWLAAAILEAQNRPPMAAKVLEIAKTVIRIRVTLMPARREASTLPPSAKTFRPKVVRRSRKSVTTRASRKSTTASGRPLYWLNSTAGPNAHRASRPVRSRISVSGREGIPAASRRLASRKAARK